MKSATRLPHEAATAWLIGQSRNRPLIDAIAQLDRLERDMTAIQMNVSDFDEAMELLAARGFKNMRGEGNVIDTGSSKTAVMISPAGYAINVVYHIK